MPPFERLRFDPQFSLLLLLGKLTQPLILLRSEYEYRVIAGPTNWVNSN